MKQEFKIWRMRLFITAVILIMVIPITVRDIIISLAGTWSAYIEEWHQIRDDYEQ